MKTRRRVDLSWLLFILPFIAAGCASIKGGRSDDPHLITHHTWWNYYLRGRLYLQEAEYAKAQNDFETALGRIPGARYPYELDRWRVRTYGMHMLEGYFPHRELGISLFYQQQYEESLKLIETSLSMEPSARARFYINRIHEQLARDAAPPPSIQIDALPRWINRRTLALLGTATASNRVAAVSINGEPEFIELARNTISFGRELILKEGENRVQVIAKDLNGKQTATNLTVMADWMPPQISLRRNGSDIAFDCSDALGLRQLNINGQFIELSGTEYTQNIPVQTDEPLRLEVSDLAGNTTAWTLSEKELRHLTQSGAAGPPSIDLHNAGTTITQFVPEYELDIRAADDTALRSVEFNGTDLLASASPLFRSLYRIPLAEGTNRLEVAAEDFDGNRTEKTMTVIYREPAYLDSIYRLAAMLSPLTGEISSPAQARRIDSIIGQKLTTPPVRFYLIAGSEELSRLQQEQMISESTFADPRAMLRKGRDLDADLVFINRILSEAPGQTVYTQVLDAHSGDQLFIEDIYVEDPAEVPAQLDGLVMKIEQRFPLIEGRIQKQHDGLAINAGEAQGVQNGLRLLVIRSEGTFAQGRILKHENRPVEVVVSEVERESAQIIMPRGQFGESALPGDYVFSR
ncbi:MAG: hypothetical protein JXR25_02555 [Pontiellaceae bacterium]|nr:hypothetical protein [Pontiellaceae bacterium]MBN2783683.1 hypothetical protein [Pontiellaceae bacterium]